MVQVTVIILYYVSPVSLRTLGQLLTHSRGSQLPQVRPEHEQTQNFRVLISFAGRIQSHPQQLHPPVRLPDLVL